MATIPTLPTIGAPNASTGEVAFATATIAAFTDHETRIDAIEAGDGFDQETLVTVDGITSVDMAAALSQVAAGSAEDAEAPNATTVLYGYDTDTSEPVMVLPATSWVEVVEFTGLTSTNAQFYTLAPGTYAQMGKSVPWAGTVFAVQVDQEEVRTGGTNTYAAKLDGSTVMSAVIDGTNTQRVLATGSAAVTAGQLLTVVQTGASYTGTVGQVHVRVYIRYAA